MKLTEEQKAVVETNGNLRINARAGTGKTSTLYHYIKARPANSKVLYIAFNKSVREEAEKKFVDIDHVFLHIRTAHSMAFEAIVKKYKYTVGFLKPEEVSKILNIRDYVMCTHVVKMVDYFCGCSCDKVQDIDYKSTLKNPLALKYVTEHYDSIELNTRKILGKMDKGEITITHDFYLKKWQLSNPTLRYDYILFDEGQDSSETMLDVFKKQKAIKVIVGDSHQQIYSWRNAINSLDKVDFQVLELSKSFRFDQDIANMAIRSIKWKRDLLNDTSLNGFMIIGAGKNKEKNTKAIIARTNVKLLSDAIERVVITKTCIKPYFEGGFANYSIGNIASIAKDILYICEGKPHKVKNPKLKNIPNKEDLKVFINEIEDASLGQALIMVETYGNKLVPYINALKEALVEDKEDADIIFTTVHKSKGMEYDEVVLMDDFSDKLKLAKSLVNIEPEFLENTLKAINEEINLVYVGITRTKGTVHMPINIFSDVTDYVTKVPNKFAKKK